MSYTFPAQVAWNANGSAPVPNASFQVYAVSDTTFTTPLAITDTNSVPLPGNILNSGRLGVFPQFMQATNATVVITDPAHVYAWTINCIPSDTSTAAFIANPASATAAQLNATYGQISNLPYIDVDLQRLITDTDDAAVWQRAVNAAKTLGIKKLVARSSVYNFGNYVLLDGVNGLTIEGGGKYATLIKPTVALNYGFTAFNDCSNIVFRNIGFQGTGVDDATSPRHSRTFTGHTGFAVAIKMQGDLRPGNTAKITNVTLDQVYITGTSGAPVLLSGIRGEAKIQGSRFHNNYDPGFIFCDTAIFINNYVTNSADNGVSLSRGNKHVVCVGNTIDNCAYWAIWIAGYDTDAGPTDVTVAGNVGVNLGYGGVCADLAPQHFTVSGNTLRNIFRGPSDQPTDIYGVGIYVSGIGDPTAPTALAQNFNISANTIIDCPRGGILLRGCKNGSVKDNTIIRPGTQYLSDGTTVVTTGNAGQNFGIAADATYSATVANVDVQDNAIIDDRGTPYLNNAAYTGSATTMWINNNRAVGNRLAASDSSRSIGGIQTFTGESRFTAGFRVGSTGASGTIMGRITGGAGSTRALSLQTDDSVRWNIKAASTAEAGSNAGSDFQLEAFSDAGVSLGAAFTVVRSTQGFRHENKPLGFYGTAPIAKPTITGSRTGESAASASTRAALVALGLATDSTTA